MPTTTAVDNRLGVAGRPRVTAHSIGCGCCGGRGSSYLAALATITLFAFVVRVLQLDYVSFHSDEASFFRIAYQGALLKATAFDDPHPPLFLAMLQGWMGLAGISQFGVRMLPVLYGTLFVPVMYQLGRLMGSRRLGLAAAFVVAANPAFIFYAKEVRDNGLLAFTGALSFVLLLLSLRRPALLPAYVVSALAALYSHYYDLPVVGLELLVGLWWLLRRRKLRWWPWAAAPAAIAIGFAPWLLYARSTIANYNAGRGTLEQVWRVLVETYAAFNLGFAVRPSDVFWFSLGMGALIVVGLAGAATVKRDLPLFLLAYALLPVLFGALTLLRQTNFNPRYLFAAAPAYALVVGSGLLLLWRFQPPAGGVAGMFLLGLTGLTVHNTDFTAEFQPNGYRELAGFLSRHATPTESMVLDGVSQWPLYFYYAQLQRGLTQRVEFLPRETPAATVDMVRQLLGGGGVWYLESDVDRYDPRHDAARLLATEGFQALDVHFGGQRLEYFRGSATGPLAPSAVSQGGLRLVGATAPDRPAPAGQALGAELDWQRGPDSVRPFKLSLRLIGADGAIAAQNDTLPLGGYADFNAWQPGQVLGVRAGLIVPVGTIPGMYMLQALTYDAASGRALGPAIELGRVAVDHSAPQRVDASELPAVGAAVSDVRLERAALPGGGVTPGDRVPVTLLWSGGRTAAPARAQLTAGAARQELMVGSDRYPTTTWQPGDLVRDVVMLRIPPSMAAGSYAVALSGVAIGRLRVLPVERSFALPPLAHAVNARFGDVAELAGYDEDVQPDGVHVELVWRAVAETETSYTAFIHLLDRNGRVASQVDTPPGTDRWVAGQVVSATYDLPPPQGEGPYRLEVGLYDQPSGVRLPVCCGSADSVMLGST